MSKKRVSGAERQTIILNAARRVFVRHGYEGAKTLDIAKEAQVSEALVYRHFPSKLALYRAVLRQVFREQDANWSRLRYQHRGAKGIIASLYAYFSSIVNEPDATTQVSYRLTLASLSGDGYLASLIYRRSQRLYVKTVAKAYDEAREDGDLVGTEVFVRNSTMFHDHIGCMMNAVLQLPHASSPYEVRGETLVRDATIFCARGLGLSDAAVRLHLEEIAPTSAAVEAPLPDAAEKQPSKA